MEREQLSRLMILNRMYPWLKILGLLIIMLIAGVGAVVFLRGTREEVAAVEEKIEKVPATGEVATAENSVNAAGPAAVSAFSPEVRAERLAGKKLVALTFDDGPLPEVTEAVLSTLAEKEARATFFMLGMQAEKYPETAGKVAAAGHEVESHSQAHRVLTGMTTEEAAEDVAAANAAISAATGRGIKFVRPPYGMFNGEISARLNEPIVTWNVDPDDWEDRDAGEITERVMGAVFDGAVVLLHDIYGTTAEALTGLIDRLREEGYEPVTVEELYELRGDLPGDKDFNV